MKINADIKQKAVSILNDTEDKSEAVVEAVETIVSAKADEIAESILEQVRTNDRSAIRPLDEKELAFYDMLKGGAKQAVTATQADVIPESIIDATLKDIKAESGVTSLIKFAPPTVKKWLFGSKTGTATWSALTDAIEGDLSVTITSESMDLRKMSVAILIPKAISDLEIGYVDAYVRAVLKDVMNDGIEEAFLDGDGKVAPIGIMRKVSAKETDGTASAKDVLDTVKELSPVGLAPVLTTLSNNGLRRVNRLALVVNPLDAYQYVNPALYGDSVTGGYVNKSFLPIEVYECANCPQGKGVFTLPGVYTMGISRSEIKSYTETKAIEDCDLIIGKVYANGRADDDNTAVVFDVTKLEEYKLPKHKA